MAEHSRWEGPARAILHGSLAFPAHASLWFAQGNWGGTLHIDAYAPLPEMEGLSLELDLRGAGRLRISVQDVAPVQGIGSPTATVIRFRGADALAGPPPAAFD